MKSIDFERRAGQSRRPGIPGNTLATPRLREAVGGSGEYSERRSLVLGYRYTLDPLGTSLAEIRSTIKKNGFKVELTLPFRSILASKSNSLSHSSASGELERENEFDFKSKTGQNARLSAIQAKNPTVVWGSFRGSNSV